LFKEAKNRGVRISKKSVTTQF